MSKKYRHISLPPRLITNPEVYEPHKGRAFETLPEIDYAQQGKKIGTKLKRINRFSERKINSLIFEEDKRSSELVLSFKSEKGFLNQALVKKYNINIFQKKDKNTYYGKISNQRLPGQEKSDLEQLQADGEHYKKTNELKSYFRTIRNIKPLRLDELIDVELKEEFKRNPMESISVDISFAEGGDLTGLKFQRLEERFGNRFSSSLNTSFVHFCRIELNYEELETTVNSFAGISYIEPTPRFLIAPSFVDHNLDPGIQIIPPPAGNNPVFVFDTAVNSQHSVLKGAVISTEGIQTGSTMHATAVASLIVCGTDITPNGEIKQSNKAIVINILEPSAKFEARVEEMVRKYSAIYPLLLINLSINEYSPGNKAYKRKPVSNLTKLIDELSWKYNCILFVSAGNLQKGLSSTVEKVLFGQTYPR